VLITRKNALASKRIYEGHVLNLRVDELKGENSKPIIREVIEHNGGVVIICQPSLDEVVLIKQYRYSVDRELVELPAGRLEAGESPLTAAKRELAEETGYLADDWKDLGKIYSAPGFCNEILYFYQASKVTKVARHLDEDEEIDVIVVPLLDAWKLALSAEINDAKTIAGLSILLRARQATV
jgi:ADP-ribose pyrophosphatase